MNLDGTTVVVTGTFPDFDEGELEGELTERGAEIVGMSPAVELVIAGKDPGSEYDEARELGIRVVDHEGLQALLAGESPRPAVTHATPPPEPDEEPVEPDLSELREEGGVPAGDDEAEPGEREFGKGARVKIVGGLEGVGKVGEIFWWGESKYGEGMRAGVSGGDDETYWVDEENLGWPDEEVPEDVIATAEEASQFSKGDRVTVVSGKHQGASGIIFWWGESKWGDGMRAGVDTDDDQTVWVDAEHLEADEDDVDDPIPF